MGERFSESELVEVREAIGTGLGELLDEGPVLDDPAELERMALIATAVVRDRDLPDEIGQVWADVLERRGDRDAATLLAAGAALAPVVAGPAGDALARLGEAGVDPALPEGFGELRARDARRGMLGDGSELYMVRMQRPAAEGEQVASVIVEHDAEVAGILVRGMISGPLEPEAAASLFDQRDSPHTPALDPVSVTEVERALRDAAAHMTERGVPAAGELALTLPLLSQAVCGDPGVLGGIPIAPPGSELFVDPQDEEGFAKVQDGVLAEFAAWVEQTGAGEALRRSGNLVAGAMLHWKWGYANGMLAHWTIEDLEQFFLDYAPRKLPAHDELVDDAPDCAAGLLRFLDEVGLLTGDPTDELVARCDRGRAEFARETRNRDRWGPAKALVTQMEAEGIDPSDEQALQGWMNDFNSRSFEERGRVIGPALDRHSVTLPTEDPEPPTPVDVPGIGEATAPARWLLAAGVDGIVLTQTHALARAVVRDAAERWPGWWDAELFGPPHREADVAVLAALHEGLRRLRLLRRRGRRLYATVRGRELAQDPPALLAVLAADLGAGAQFATAVAAAVTGTLAARDQSSHADLAAAALAHVRRGGWHDGDGRPPTSHDVSWVVGDVVRRAEAYGLIERHPDPTEPLMRASQIALSEGGRLLLGVDRRGSAAMRVLVFDADLVGVRGVRARLAVGADQHLTALHDAIQEAFGWYDDHLYSFWLDGTFWGDKEREFTTPETPDEGRRTADVPLAELDLAVGAKIAYVFDFGDEWRVRLTLREQIPADDGAYPRVLHRKGKAPPQYAGSDEY